MLDADRNLAKQMHPCEETQVVLPSRRRVLVCGMRFAVSLLRKIDLFRLSASIPRLQCPMVLLAYLLTELNAKLFLQLKPKRRRSGSEWQLLRAYVQTNFVDSSVERP